MQAGSNTVLAREAEHSFQNSQAADFEVSSKLSSSNYSLRQKQVQKNHEQRSQAPLQHTNSLQSTNYKRILLKLMTLVKLEDYGYKQADMQSIVDSHIAGIEGLETIEGKDLDIKASEISLRIVEEMIGAPHVAIPRFSHHGSSVRSQVPPLEVNMEVLQPERIEEMEERLEIQDRVNEIPEIEERRVFPIMPRLPLPRLQVGLRMRREVLREQEEERVEPPMPEILCNICYVLSRNYCEEDCGHSFCLECLKGYLRENLRSGNYIIKCPEYECTEQISLQIIKKVLTKQEFQRFLYFRDKNQKQMNPDNKFCSKPDCGELLQKAQDRLRCPRCESIYCQICLQPYHNQAPCDIILRHSMEHTYKSFQIKKCPGCKSPIEKSEGCNHMTCKKCKHQFCWLCLGKYSRHHYKYYNCFGCPGMQFQDPQEFLAERCKQLLLYLLLPFILALVLFCYFSAIPLYALGCLVYKPCLWADSGRDFFEDAIVQAICCCLGPASSKAFLWLLYQPRAIMYAVFISPAKLTMMFCGQLCKIFQ